MSRFCQVGQSWYVNHSYLRRYNNSLVVCSWLVAELPRWTTCATSSFVPDRERLSPVCNHHAEIDCLFMHLFRANYQAAIWKCCLHARTKCELIDGDGKLAIHWIWSPPASDAVLELLACKCVRWCKLLKKVYEHGKWTSIHRHVLQVAVVQ